MTGKTSPGCQAKQVRDDRQSESGMTAKAISGRQKLQIRPDIFKFPWGESITLCRSATERVEVAFFQWTPTDPVSAALYG
jgi:hypothetical protein